MKKSIILGALLGLSFLSSGQTKITLLKDSIHYQFLEESRDTTPQETKYVLTLKDGTNLPIYRSKNNKLFVLRTSKKTGNIYKQYLSPQN